MKRVVLFGLCLLIAGGVLWFTRSGAAPVEKPALAAAEPEAPALPAPLPPVPVLPAPDDDEPSLAEALGGGRLDPKSDAFRERIEEDIPQHLIGEASRCYKASLHRDKKIKLEFRLTVADSAVSISDVRVVKSTLEDEGVERCIRDTVASARWRDEEMPDYESDEELFIRMRGFAKFVNKD
jgi:hypothetical protein